MVEELLDYTVLNSTLRPRRLNLIYGQSVSQSVSPIFTFSGGNTVDKDDLSQKGVLNRIYDTMIL